MRIAMFHEVHLGGARRSVNEFAKQLKKKHTVDLYYVDDLKNSIEENNFSNSFFYNFTSQKWTGKNWKVKLYKDTIELFRLFLLHKKIATDISNKNYDAVFVEPSRFTQAPFILQFLPKKNTFYYSQEPLRLVYDKAIGMPKNIDPFRYFYEKVNRFIRKHIDRKNISSAGYVLANSVYTKRNIFNAYGIKSTVCYMGVDTTFFKPEKISKNVDILFVGAKDTVDGYTLLEGAIKYMDKKPKVEILANDAGWITDDALHLMYAKAKIALCLAKNEPFGLVPLEAMSCGVPVIAIDEGGYRESVVNGKNGYLIPRDEKVLGKVIQETLSNDKKLRYFAKSTREHILKQWTWEKSGHNLEQILKDNTSK